MAACELRKVAAPPHAVAEEPGLAKTEAGAITTQSPGTAEDGQAETDEIAAEANQGLAVLADVYPDGLDEVIATDVNPEAAIADWKRLAAAYEEQAQGRPAEERKDFFEILLIMSCGVSMDRIPPG